jgi:hypothetical protein
LDWLVKADTMKRKLKWTAICLALLVLGFGVALFLWPRDRITRESCEQIRIGMTEKEVEGILGGQGMDAAEYREALKKQAGRFRQAVGRGPLQMAFNFGGYRRFWIGRRGYMEIHFEQDEVVFFRNFQEWEPTDPNIIDRLRDWLGW